MKKLYPLLLLLLLMFSCKDEISIDMQENSLTPNPESNFNFGSTVQRNFQGVVLDTGGNPVNGATVTIGSNTVQTNFKGFFTFKNANVKENFALVKVTKSGFIDGSRVMVPTSGINRMNIMMIPATTIASVNSGATSTVSLPNGTKVKFDGSFKDASGNTYSGSVNVALYNLASSNQYLTELMPGSLLATNSGGSARIMETFGMVHVQLTGSSGQKLQIANGHTAEMTVPIDASQTSGSPNTIPLWSYDENTGMWNEEGTATKVGNTYVGTVSHFSWWNCDAQFPQAILKVTVKNPAGLPMVNAKVSLKRSSQAYETYGMTDNLGTVTGIIPANEVLVLKVYDICNAVVYTSNVAPVIAGTTMTLPDITVTSTGNQYIIQGNLKTCANTDVTDGYVLLRPAAGTNYFQYISVPVSGTGNFSFNVYSCTANPQFILEGYDYTNLQTSGEIPFTANLPIMNFNNVSVCNSVSEFISYKIDNQNVKYILGNINAQWSGLTSPSPNMPAKQLRINSASPAGYSFYMTQNNMLGVPGSFNADYIFEFSGGFFTPATGNVVVQVTNFGAVGTYIDFTVNGTYTDSGGSHTFISNGHVIRDL
ncbi:uncharacterized protein UPF0560 [Chryseobacterium sp. 52]|uniref:carboxypeptidase-like regulatory domain-containing protein n=1 Tax=Chryseobacterium sp. 52 TaxID=2035213 RepID=UPI000C5E3091|nr:carboxypeptidase-like regulatory domain-containing protein [Chryseobacterium sp. 52]PIF43263.1 uncharacterized protein UPF0560 [Chryseobacterium sp. 52]